VCLRCNCVCTARRGIAKMICLTFIDTIICCFYLQWLKYFYYRASVFHVTLLILSKKVVEYRAVFISEMTRWGHVCCSTLLLLIISIALAIPKPDDKERKDRVLDNVSTEFM
jgi:hypothetical protein